MLSTTLAEIRDAAGEEGRSAGPAPVRVAEPGQSSDVRDTGVPSASGERRPDVSTAPELHDQPAPAESALPDLSAAPLPPSSRPATPGLEQAPAVDEPDRNASRDRAASSPARQRSRSIGGPRDAEEPRQRWVRDLASRAMAQPVAHHLAHGTRPQVGPPEVVRGRQGPRSLATPTATLTPRAISTGPGETASSSSGMPFAPLGRDEVPVPHPEEPGEMFPRR